MSELKVGDKVFVGPAEVTEIQDDLWIHTSLDRTGKEVVAFGYQLIPATDNLAAVARVIAEHPGIGEAVNTATIGLALMVNDASTASEFERFTDALGMVRALATALNGGTE